jgi:hypothetical protein
VGDAFAGGDARDDGNWVIGVDIINGLLGLLVPPGAMGVAMNASTPMFLVMTMKFYMVSLSTH